MNRVDAEIASLRLNSNNSLESIEKINSLETKRKRILSKLKEYQNEDKNIECPVCLDQIHVSMMICTSCCNSFICPKCLDKLKTCPICRKSLSVTQIDCLQLVDNKSHVLPTKSASEVLCDLLSQILEQNSESKIVLLSLRPEDFTFIRDNPNIKPRVIAGQASFIGKIIESYKEGDTNLLILHAYVRASGLNLENTTDVIFFHKVPIFMENQGIGRALRLGRDPENVLRVHYLLPK